MKSHPRLGDRVDQAIGAWMALSWRKLPKVQKKVAQSDDRFVNSVHLKRWGSADIRQIIGQVWQFQVPTSSDSSPDPAWYSKLGATDTEGARHNAEQVHRLFDAAADFDITRAGRYLHEECSYWNIPFPAWSAGKSRRGTLRQLRALSAVVSEYRVLEYLQLTAGENAVVVDRLECLRILGVRCELRVVALFEFRAGMIFSWNDDFSIRDLSVGFLRSLFRPTSASS